MAELHEIFNESPLFQGLSESQINDLISVADMVPFEKGKIVVHQGDVGDDFYLICSGKVEVLKEKQSGIYHQVAILNPGSTIGELSMIDQGYRSATVRVLEDAKLLRIRGSDFRKIVTDSTIGTLTYRNLAVDLSQRLRRTNEVTVAALEQALEQTKKQVVVGNFMVSILIILTLFTFALGIMTHLTHIFGTSGYVTVALLVITTIMMVNLVIQSGYPISFYGLTLKNWRFALSDALSWSLPVIVLATVAKGVVIYLLPEFKQEPLFNFSGALYHAAESAGGGNVLFLAALYVFASSPLQEFLFRGCFQGTLQFFLIGQNAGRIAIITTSLIFSMVHLMISPILAFFAFSGGIFWGELYRRHGTLVGVIISHMVIGAWLFFVLGIEHMLVGKIG
jgi:CRP-like cAMP-binding protein